jgi:hypothetical protein
MFLLKEGSKRSIFGRIPRQVTARNKDAAGRATT